MTDVLVLTEPEVRGLIDRPAALAAVRSAFAALAEGRVRQPDVLSLDLPESDGEVHAKGAHIGGSAQFTIKVAAGFYRNPERGLPVASGAVFVFDASTGRPSALLFENGFLTDLRTAAAGALSSDLLAVPDARTAAVIGAGGQARYQLRALADLRELGRVAVWARRPEAAHDYAAEMTRELGLPVAVAESAAAAVRDAQIVITTTPAREPLIAADWIAPGTHVCAIGSDLPGKAELEPALLARATVVADRIEQCRTQGEIAHALQAGAIALEQVHGELGEIVVGRRPGRRSESEITIADLTGVGALDAAVASYVTERALASGAGRLLAI